MQKLIGVLVVCMFVLMTGCSTTNFDPQADALAQCLTEKNITMFGTETCTHCQKQKSLFGDSFAKVQYVDCYKDTLLCQTKGIMAFPTRQKEDGVQTE